MATQASSVTTETASSQGCLLFSPTADQARLSAALEDIPRYLFRVHAPKTAGQTTNKEVISRAAMLGKPGATTDILSMPARSAAEMLNSHLRGWSRDGDNLMSWSSSLLFALQYALYRNIKERDRDELADIRVHVLDTSGLPPGALLPDAPLLDAFADKDSWKTYNLAKIRSLRRDTSYNFGEYLSQGTLSIEGRSTSTSLQEIINHGLFKLCPEMGEPNEKPELAKRVCRLRADCFATSVATSKLEIRIALSLAEGCFGDEWALPMMAALLSLRRRRRNDSVIVDAFSANFSEKELRKHDLGALKSFSNEKLPEVYQFEKIIQDIHSYHCTRALDSVIATTMRLSLSSQSPLKPKEHVTYIDVGDEVWEV
ncbi:hypothetical protein CkaCkLH20_05995 [Colletotrichum karsti]|uniref:DUF7587 domain-containing protein n=1 Tax=Colletotrichum karsti TaxID=1095194 RepID=A0A9P6LLH5_9PEZI|nr:uncharacterized protein CkaCkLH20_05995 [Colletotrichum karsti]KAF9876587.1 hypothetical protein CkaCkLH20_05995 [Colletotrichum karsti]